MTLILNGTDNSATTPAVTGTDTDTGVYYPAANQIALATNGTLAVLTNASQNTGFGTASPGARVEVYVQRTSSTNATAIILNDNVTSAQTNGVYKSIQSLSNNGASVSEIRFLESDGTNNNTAIAFATSATAGGISEKMRVLNTGAILALSGASTTATGTGIGFPATQSASSDSNVLDDYEEGTWTPGVAFGGGSTGVTYNATYNRGWYTRVGNLVTCTMALEVSNKGSSTGDMTLTGFPFSSTKGDASISHAVSTSSVLLTNPISAYGTLFTGVLTVVKQQSGAQGIVQNTDCSTSFSVLGTICYLI